MVLKEVRSTEVFITLQQSLIFLPYIHINIVAKIVLGGGGGGKLAFGGDFPGLPPPPCMKPCMLWRYKLVFLKSSAQSILCTL